MPSEKSAREEAAEALEDQAELWELATPLIERGDNPIHVPFLALHDPIAKARAAASKLREEKGERFSKTLPTGWGYYWRLVHYSAVEPQYRHADIVRVWSLPDGSKTFAPTYVSDLEVEKHEEYFGVPVEWSGPIPEPARLLKEGGR